VHPELVVELEDQLESDIDDEVRAEILLAISDIEYRFGHLHEIKIIEYLQESLTLYRRLSNPTAIVFVLNSLAALYAKQGNWNGLLQTLSEAFEITEGSGDSQGHGRALLYFAIHERFQGCHDIAVWHYERAIQLFEEAGDIVFLAVAFNNLADLEIAQGRLAEALYRLRQALFLWRIIGHREKTAIILSQMGRVSVLKGNIPEAQLFLDSANNLMSADQARNPLELVYELSIQAELERSQGNLQQALKFKKRRNRSRVRVGAND
jgi:Tfp pilus assembly protein PilF